MRTRKPGINRTRPEMPLAADCGRRIAAESRFQMLT